MKAQISKAKAGLILDQPFFATLLLSMKIIESTDSKAVPTMATDGESIFYNAQWVSTLKLPEIQFVLAHEALHAALAHCLRRGQRNPNRWNIAADYCINELLTKEKVGVMPKGGLLDSNIVKQGGGTAEGIYKLLPKDTESKEAGQPGSGGSMDKVLDAGQTPGNAPNQSGLDPAKIKELEGQMRVRVLQARNAAKACGKGSQAIDDFVGSLTKAKVDWKYVLRKFFDVRAKEHSSYARPKRRFLASDIILPSLLGEKLGVVAVAVDESGSIGPDELRVFASELFAILGDLAPRELRVIHFADSVAQPIEIFTPDNMPTEFKAKTCGGTAFAPIFEEINTWSEMPAACVVLTDLESDDFGPTPEFPVLWVSTHKESAPFGEIVKLETE